MFSKSKVLMAVLVLLTFSVVSAHAKRYIGFNVTEIYEDGEYVETHYSNYDVGDDDDGYVKIYFNTTENHYYNGELAWTVCDSVQFDTDGVLFIAYIITTFPEIGQYEQYGYWRRTYPDGTVETGTY